MIGSFARRRNVCEGAFVARPIGEVFPASGRG
jgi:hypothetical protein